MNVYIDDKKMTSELRKSWKIQSKKSHGKILLLQTEKRRKKNYVN